MKFYRQAPMHRALAGLMAFVLASGQMAYALPTGWEVESGDVSFEQINPSTLNIISRTNTAVINYQSFNIAHGETVNFLMPESLSSILNRVLGGGPSNIAGIINSNGQVMLINPAGINIASTANINTGAFLASSLGLNSADYLSGNWNFKKDPGGSGAIVNEGDIRAQRYAVLIGSSVKNRGNVSVPLGSAIFAVGDQVRINVRPGVAVDVVVDEGLRGQLSHMAEVIGNQGTIDAHAVEMAAKVEETLFNTVINQDGIVRANQISNEGGKINIYGESANGNMLVKNTGELHADGTLGVDGGDISVRGNTVENTGKITANATDGGDGGNIGISSTRLTDLRGGQISASALGNTGNGGKVMIWSDGNTNLRSNATILANGGRQGGDGGFIDLSGKNTVNWWGRMDASAPHGAAGTIMLDPTDIVIDIGGADVVADDGNPATADTDNSVGNCNAGSGVACNVSAGTLDFANNVYLIATNDITVNSAMNITTPGAYVRLAAANNININNNITTNNGNISLEATAGNVNVANTATLTTGGGNVNMAAGGNVVVDGNVAAGTGSVTASGSNVTVNNGGAFNGSALNVTASNGVLLDRAINLTPAGSSMNIQGGGLVDVQRNLTTNGGGIALTSTGGNVNVGASSLLTTTSGNATVTANSGTAILAGDITSGAGTTTVNAVDINTASTSVITSNGATMAATNTLSHAGDVVAGANVANLSGNSITITSTGSVTTTGTAINVTGGSGTVAMQSAAADSFLTSNNGNITVSAGAGGNLNLNGDITAGTGSVTLNAPTISVTGSTGSVSGTGVNMSAGTSLTSTVALNAGAQDAIFSAPTMTLGGAMTNMRDFVTNGNVNVLNSGTATASRDIFLGRNGFADTVTVGNATLTATRDILLLSSGAKAMDGDLLAGNNLTVTGDVNATGIAQTPVFRADNDSNGVGTLTVNNLTYDNDALILRGAAINLNGNVNVGTGSIAITGPVTTNNNNVTLTGNTMTWAVPTFNLGTGALDIVATTTSSVATNITGRAVTFNRNYASSTFGLTVNATDSINVATTRTVSTTSGAINMTTTNAAGAGISTTGTGAITSTLAGGNITLDSNSSITNAGTIGSSASTGTTTLLADTVNSTGTLRGEGVTITEKGAGASSFTGSGTIQARNLDLALNMDTINLSATSSGRDLLLGRVGVADDVTVSGGAATFTRDILFRATGPKTVTGGSLLAGNNLDIGVALSDAAATVRTIVLVADNDNTGGGNLILPSLNYNNDNITVAVGNSSTYTLPAVFTAGTGTLTLGQGGAISANGSTLRAGTISTGGIPYNLTTTNIGINTTLTAGAGNDLTLTGATTFGYVGRLIGNDVSLLGNVATGTTTLAGSGITATRDILFGVAAGASVLTTYSTGARMTLTAGRDIIYRGGGNKIIGGNHVATNDILLQGAGTKSVQGSLRANNHITVTGNITNSDATAHTAEMIADADNSGVGTLTVNAMTYNNDVMTLDGAQVLLNGDINMENAGTGVAVLNINGPAISSNVARTLTAGTLNINDTVTTGTAALTTGSATVNTITNVSTTGTIVASAIDMQGSANIAGNITTPGNFTMGRAAGADTVAVSSTLNANNIIIRGLGTKNLTGTIRANNDLTVTGGINNHTNATVFNPLLMADFDNAGGGTLTIGTALNYNNDNLTLRVGTTGTMNVGADINTGTGALTFNGVVNATAPISISGGLIHFDRNVNHGANMLTLAGPVTTDNNSVTFNGTAPLRITGGSVDGGTGILTFTEAIDTNNTNLTLDAALINLNGGSIAAGTGTLNLNGPATTNNNPMTISGSTLNFNDTFTSGTALLTANATTQLNVNSAVSSTNGNINLNMTNAGGTGLTVANTGSVTSGNGNVTLSSQAALTENGTVSTTNGNIAINSQGALNQNGAVSSTNGNLALNSQAALNQNGTLSTNAGTVGLTANAANLNNTVTAGGGISVTGQGAGANVTTTAASNLVATAGTDVSIQNFNTGTFSGTIGLVRDISVGINNLTLNGGTTALNAGRDLILGRAGQADNMTLSPGAVISVGRNILIQGTGTKNITANLSAPNDITISGPITGAGGGATPFWRSDSDNVGGGTLSLDAVTFGNANLVLNGGSTGSILFNGNIDTGLGTLDILTAFTQSGNIVLDGSTIFLARNVNHNAFNLTLAGPVETRNNSISFSGAGTLFLTGGSVDGGTGTLTFNDVINTSNNTLTLDGGLLNLNGGSIQAGTGTLNLNGPAATNNNALALGAAIINFNDTFNAGNGNLTATATNAVNVSNALSSGSGNINLVMNNAAGAGISVAGGGTVTSTSGGVALDSQTLVDVSGTINSGAGATTLTANTLNVGNNVSGTGVTLQGQGVAPTLNQTAGTISAGTGTLLSQGFTSATIDGEVNGNTVNVLHSLLVRGTGRVESTNDLTLGRAGLGDTLTIRGGGVVSAGRDGLLRGTGTKDIEGTVEAGRHLTVSGAVNSLNAGTATPLFQASTAGAGGILTLDGVTYNNDDVTFRSTNGSIVLNGNVQSGGELLFGGPVNTNATLTIDGSQIAFEDVVNFGANNLTLAGPVVDNGNDLTFNGTGTLFVTGGSIDSGANDLFLNSVVNTNNTNLVLDGNEINLNGGSIQAGTGTLDLNGEAYTNDNNLTLGAAVINFNNLLDSGMGDLTANATTAINVNDSIGSDSGSVTLNMTGAAGTGISIDANGEVLSNTGTITLDSQTDLTNDGTIDALDGSVAISAQTVTNNNSILGTGITVTGQGVGIKAFVNSPLATLDSCSCMGDLSITNFDTADIDGFLGGRDMLVQADTISVNDNAQILADRNIVLGTALGTDVINVAEAIIASGNNITLNGQGGISMNGAILAGNDLTVNGSVSSLQAGAFTPAFIANFGGTGPTGVLTVGNMTYNNDDLALGGTQVNLNGNVNTGTGKLDILGPVTTGASITLTASGISFDSNVNHGANNLTLAGPVSTFDANVAFNGTGTLIVTGGSIDSGLGTLSLNSAVSTSNNALTLSGALVNLNGGGINAGTGGLTLDAEVNTNGNAATLTSGALALNNNVTANGGLTLQGSGVAATLTQASGTTLATGPSDLQSQGFNSATLNGTITGNDITLDHSVQLTSTAVMTAANDLTLGNAVAANNITIAHGAQANSTGDMVVQGTGIKDILGDLQSDSDLTIDGAINSVGTGVQTPNFTAAGTLTMDGATYADADLTLSGAQVNITGNVNTGAGTLALDGPVDTLNNNVALSGAGITVNDNITFGSGNLAVNAPLSTGGGNLVMTGTGGLTLNAPLTLGAGDFTLNGDPSDFAVTSTSGISARNMIFNLSNAGDNSIDATLSALDDMTFNGNSNVEFGQNVSLLADVNNNGVGNLNFVGSTFDAGAAGLTLTLGGRDINLGEISDATNTGFSFNTLMMNASRDVIVNTDVYAVNRIEIIAGNSITSPGGLGDINLTRPGLAPTPQDQVLLNANNLIGTQLDPLNVHIANGRASVLARGSMNQISVYMNGQIGPTDTLSLNPPYPGRVIYNGVIIYDPFLIAPPPVFPVDGAISSTRPDLPRNLFTDNRGVLFPTLFGKKKTVIGSGGGQLGLNDDGFYPVSDTGIYKANKVKVDGETVYLYNPWMPYDPSKKKRKLSSLFW